MYYRCRHQRSFSSSLVIIIINIHEFDRFDVDCILYGNLTKSAQVFLHTSYHIKTWQLTTSADQLRTYKIHGKYYIKHNIANHCERNVSRTHHSR